MGSYREVSNHAKAVRAGIIDARPVGRKSKRPKPVVLYAFLRYAWEKAPAARWEKHAEYRDETTAHSVAKNLAHKYRFMLRFRLGVDGEEFDPRNEKGSP